VADGILPIKLHHDRTRAGFRDRVEIASNQVVLNERSAQPLIVVPPAFFPPVELTITAKAPDGTLMEVVKQTLTLAIDMAGRRSLVPTSASTQQYGAISAAGHGPYLQTVAQWKDRLHPRLTASSSPSGHEFPVLEVDLTFVDASYYFATPRDKDTSDLVAAYHGVLFGQRRPHHGCRLHAFELTRKEGPATWLAIVPPSASTAVYNPLQGSLDQMLPQATDRGASEFDVLIHLRPIVRGPRYDAIEKTHGLFGNLTRFFAEPSPEQPFFAGRNGRWSSFPDIGFEKQLVKSGKRVIIAYPWPSVLDFGVVLHQGGPRLCAEKVVLALRAIGAIAAGHALDVRLGRLGIAGFSGGANQTIKAWLANRPSIDELWLIDPQSFQFDQDRRQAESLLLLDGTQRVRRELIEWFRDDRRRLRLIGGLRHVEALQIAATLDAGWRRALEKHENEGAPAPRVWCKPETREFRIGVGAHAIYSWAFLPALENAEPDAAGLAAHRLTAAGKPPSDLTAATGLELIDDAKPDSVTVRVVDAKTDAVFPVSHAELAGFLRTLWVPKPDPPSREAKLWSVRVKNGSPRVQNRQTVAALQTLVSFYMLFGRDEEHQNRRDPAWGIRHQWAPCGGQRDPTRRDKFEGYYYLCLRDSGFR
jgi:hypothetical protein